MAKKLNTDTEETTESIQPVQATTMNNPVPQSDKPQNPETEPEKLPAHASQILSIFKNYNALYIDSFGGAYSPTTPESMRGNAVKYDNPFHE